MKTPHYIMAQKLGRPMGRRSLIRRRDMSERLLDKHELLSLLGNCILVCALSNDENLLDRAKDAATLHMNALDERFPEWRDEAKTENITFDDYRLM
jgi:hypothetical protein